MTWANFKAAMQRAGVREDDEISYIDIGNYEEIDVQFERQYDARLERDVRVVKVL